MKTTSRHDSKLSQLIDAALIDRMLNANSKVRDSQLAMWKHMAIELEKPGDSQEEKIAQHD